MNIIMVMINIMLTYSRNRRYNTWGCEDKNFLKISA